MLFDIRTIVGALLGCYGVILVVTGLVGETAEERARAGGWNPNLWAGIGMVVVALAFVAWVVLRPVKELVHENPETPEAPTTD
ncbi:hypothetical protein [Nocardia transvalensis]|uniref:hypothetical protein n=1 Tax=Nocardia transvalensis TaxID=37333 RepID=UPI001895B32A|nr:hypothetical protein [Nocardia transvalensis]MBF6326995.1 hypothetical protein [Nocardia transvalensis]